MKQLFFGIFAIAAIGISPSVAGDDWMGEGWYQISYSSDMGGSGQGGMGIHDGAFEDEASCLETLPEDEEDGTTETFYECRYLKKKSDL